MSGFEALGLACNIFQTISFARETITVCRDIYNGQKTPDEYLYDNAKGMQRAADAIKSQIGTTSKPVKTTKHRRQTTGEAAEKEMVSIAEKCAETADKLDKMVEDLVAVPQGDVRAAVTVRFKSLRRKSKIQSLDQALQRYTDTMQILLTTRLCDKATANTLATEEGFQKLDRQLQIFILQIAAGNTKIEDLLKDEGVTTRSHITAQTERVETSMKQNIHNERKDYETTRELRRQHERLLSSLKFPEMNKRRNDIMEPEDAIFERIFRSYEEIAGGLSNNDEDESSTKDIDAVWKSFVDWLRSDKTPLFWIQGKPGSGKSTLIKYIIANKATQGLLDEWKPNSRIVSHYFVTIGSPLQRNLKGLYCSLIFQLLQDKTFDESEPIVQQLKVYLPASMTKDYVADWSFPELKKLLKYILEFQRTNEPLCFFIDGLDEYKDEDGQGGQIGLLNQLQALVGPNRKLCIASRPEPLLWRRLHQESNLKLHDLTWPDMETYTRNQLLSLQYAHTIARNTIDEITSALLTKAEGVFLWIHLSLESLKSGFLLPDTVEELFTRIEELPPKLEKLYEDMWKRMNQDTSIYRESAAKYLRLVIIAIQHFPEGRSVWMYFCDPNSQDIPTSKEKEVHKIPEISLFELACATKEENESHFINMRHTTVPKNIKSLEETCEAEIRKRCAGLLEIIPSQKIPFNFPFSPVTFIHRTAYDFLTNEPAGKAILDHDTTPLDEMRCSLSKASICLFQMLYYHHQFRTHLADALEVTRFLTSDQHAESSRQISQRLPLLQCLYQQDGPFWDESSCPFLSRVGLFPLFDAYSLEELKNTERGEADTILRHLLVWEPYESYHEISYPSVQVVQSLLSQGATPLARNLQTFIYKIRQYPPEEDDYFPKIIIALLQASPAITNHLFTIKFTVQICSLHTRVHLFLDSSIIFLLALSLENNYHLPHHAQMVTELHDLSAQLTLCHQPRLHTVILEDHIKSLRQFQILNQRPLKPIIDSFLSTLSKEHQWQRYLEGFEERDTGLEEILHYGDPAVVRESLRDSEPDFKYI